VNDADTSGFAEAVRVARGADAVVLVLGEDRDMSAEAKSRASIALPGVQQRLADGVLAAGKPVVVVLMNGRPLAIPELAARAPAIIESWFLGIQTGPAVADVVFGDHNPSGKLPITFPRATGQVPIYYNHKNTGRPPTTAGDYEPYRSNYVDVQWTPLYPFGHGLSYTTFAYSEPRLSAARVAAGDSVVVTVDVSNTGRRPGDEVVQLYVRDEVASVTPAVKRLRGFRRVSLEPGERRTVSFVLRREDLELWGLDMRPRVEPGFFTVTVGGSSEGGRSARFEVVR
jgi:beta-glucosidase